MMMRWQEFRPDEGVDIAASPDGGYHVGFIKAGESMRYTVDVTKTSESWITSKPFLTGGAPNPNPIECQWNPIHVYDTLRCTPMTWDLFILMFIRVILCEVETS